MKKLKVKADYYTRKEEYKGVPKGVLDLLAQTDGVEQLISVSEEKLKEVKENFFIFARSFLLLIPDVKKK